MKLTVVGLTAFFPVLINTIQGAKGVDPVLIDTARTFGHGNLTILRKIILPSAMPLILAGMRIGLALALIVVVTTEMVVGTGGLGFLIVDMQRSFKVLDMYAWLVILALVGPHPERAVRRRRAARRPLERAGRMRIRMHPWNRLISRSNNVSRHILARAHRRRGDIRTGLHRPVDGAAAPEASGQYDPDHRHRAARRRDRAGLLQGRRARRRHHADRRRRRPASPPSRPDRSRSGYSNLVSIVLGAQQGLGFQINRGGQRIGRRAAQHRRPVCQEGQRPQDRRRPRRQAHRREHAQ